MFCPVHGHPVLLNKYIDSTKLSNWVLGVPQQVYPPSLVVCCHSSVHCVGTHFTFILILMHLRDCLNYLPDRHVPSS